MMRATPIAFAMLVSVATACRPATDRRESRDFERMRQQQRYDSYEPSGFFKNGAVMQAPPAHTVARGSAYAPEVMPATGAEQLAAGGRQFAISCAPCHGVGGFGGGPIAANLVERRPPSLRVPPASTLDSAALFTVITNGFGKMPPYGWQMPPETRWAVVAYVRALGSLPSSEGSRADSMEAFTLHRIDSLRAAGTKLPQLLRDLRY